MNDKVALTTFDNIKVYVLDYNDGDALAGTGSGASVANFRKSAAIGTIGHTIGTAWLDNNNVIVVGTQVANPRLYTVDATTMAVTPRVDLPPFFASGNSRVTEVEYNPAISPYIYVLYSLFSGETENRLSVVDPATWTVLNTIRLTSSLETSRELAFGPDKRLYLSQFAGSGSLRFIDSLTLDLVAPFGTIDLADTTALTDNASEDHYRKNAVESTTSNFNSNFSGMDIALTTSAIDPARPVTGSCCLPAGAGCVSAVSNAVCVSLGGVFNAGLDCSACPAATGACCEAAGVCVVRTKVDCDTALGLYFGDGSTCTATACAGPGACCLPDGTCVSGLADNCYNNGGYFQGVGSACGTCPVLPSTEITVFDFEFTEPFVASGRNLGFTRNPDLSGSTIPGTYQTAGGMLYSGSDKDVFGIVDRNVSTDFRDDTPPGPLTQDVFGILDFTNNTKVFGVEDLYNVDDGGTGTGTGTATWTFDVSGYKNLAVAIEFASMGNFENSGASPAPADSFNFRFSLNGGANQDLFLSAVEAPSSTPAINFPVTPVYPLMNAGTRAQYDLGTLMRDPISMRAGGTTNRIVIRNDFARLVKTGILPASTLTISFTATHDGGFEVFAFDNIRVLGTPIETGCALADLDNDGTVEVSDLFDYLDAWFLQNGTTGPNLLSDADGDGDADVVDLFLFLDAWFMFSGTMC